MVSHAILEAVIEYLEEQRSAAYALVTDSLRGTRAQVFHDMAEALNTESHSDAFNASIMSVHWDAIWADYTAVVFMMRKGGGGPLYSERVYDSLFVRTYKLFGAAMFPRDAEPPGDLATNPRVFGMKKHVRRFLVHRPGDPDVDSTTRWE
jgi:hypothetical protein